MIFVRSIPTVLSVLSLLVLSGCSTSSAIERSRNFASLGDFKHAYEEIQAEYARQQAGGAVDEQVAEVRREMRLKYLRDKAQQLIFTEREDDALRVLATLEELDPGYPGIVSLRDAAELKKAERIVSNANEDLARKDFVAAMSGYLESQKLIPGFEPAEEGITKVREETARMSARAQQQFLQAVRKVPEFRHVEVAWHAAAVIHLTPDATDEQRANAAAIGKHAKHESAQLTFEEAKACEAKNQFGAALVLYKAAALLNPELAAAADAVAKMESELKAVALLEKAQLAMRTNDFVAANDLLKEAHELSRLSRGEISELMIQSRQLEGEKHYQEARDLEVMGQKEPALRAFEELVKQYPDGIKDESARITGLKLDVESAKSAWAAAEQAEAAGDLKKALENYETAESFYAEWRDGEAHIERLRKAIAEQAAKSGANGETSGG